MKNEITLDIVIIASALAIVTAILTIVSNNVIHIVEAQSGVIPNSPQLSSPQINFQDNQRFIPPGLIRDIEQNLLGNGQQITMICHIPPGNPANQHTIQISSHALRAHLAHGDALGSCTSNGNGNGNGQQITMICHIPPGNPANQHTIQISSHALRAHLAHGDALGSCTSNGNGNGNGQQITMICHIPPGNPANQHTIQISSHALRAHLAHGDALGSCIA